MWSVYAGSKRTTALRVTCPAATVKSVGAKDQWQGSRWPGASTQTSQEPGARSASVKLPSAAVLAVRTGPSMAAVALGFAGAARPYARTARGIGFPSEEITVPRIVAMDTVCAQAVAAGSPTITTKNKK